MINIVICDDDKNDVITINDSIKSIISKFGNEIRTYCFYESDEVESFLLNNKIDYIFLDIELKNGNGFELAGKIQNRYADARIFFVSNYEERVFEAFRYNPPKFIRKSKFEVDMREALNLLELWISESLQRICIKVNNEEITINNDKIKYIDTYQNYLIYHLVNNSEIKQRKTLKTFSEENKSKNMLQINAGCIVNMKFIERIKNRRVILTSGESFGVGRNIEKEIRNKFIMYRLENEEIL